MNLKEYNLYYPILRNKQGELKALGNIQDKEGIKPVIEVTPNTLAPSHRRGRGGKSITVDRVRSVAKAISSSWKIDSPIYIDVLPLGDGTLSYYKAHPMEELFKYFRTGDYKIHAIPAIRLDSTITKRTMVSKICSQDGRGVLLRVNIASTANLINDAKPLTTEIDKIIKDLGIGRDQVDLILDLEEMIEITYTAYSSTLAIIINHIPYLKDWRNFILSSGAFPIVINYVLYGSQKPVPRYDWMLWHKIATNPVNRIPAYSDYTNVSFNTVEVNAEFMDVPPNTRYALSSEWIIYRDESNTRKKGSNKYFDQCKRLVSDKVVFMGSGFSTGDQSIKTASTYAGVLPLPSGVGPGNSQKWRENDVNHHITLTAQQTKSVP